MPKNGLLGVIPARHYISYKVLPGTIFLAKNLQEYRKTSIFFGKVSQEIHFLDGSCKILQGSEEYCIILKSFARLFQRMFFFQLGKTRIQKILLDFNASFFFNF